MPDFIFPPPDDFLYHDEETAKAREDRRRDQAELAASMSAALVRGYGMELRERRAPTSRTIALRIPLPLLVRLDAVAIDAATGRSHLIRQMIADYLNSMQCQGIRFSGCLLSVDKVDPGRH